MLIQTIIFQNVYYYPFVSRQLPREHVRLEYLLGLRLGAYCT